MTPYLKKEKGDGRGNGLAGKGSSSRIRDREKGLQAAKDRLGAKDTGRGVQVNLGLKAELLVAHNHLRMELQWCEDKESRKTRGKGLGEVRVGWGISKNKNTAHM